MLQPFGINLNDLPLMVSQVEIDFPVSSSDSDENFVLCSVEPGRGLEVVESIVESHGSGRFVFTLEEPPEQANVVNMLRNAPAMFPGDRRFPSSRRE